MEGDFIWYKDDLEVDEDVEKVDETSSKLFIRKAKMGDSGRYTCECTPDNGRKSSNSLTIFVYGKSGHRQTFMLYGVEVGAGLTPSLTMYSMYCTCTHPYTH